VIKTTAETTTTPMSTISGTWALALVWPDFMAPESFQTVVRAFVVSRPGRDDNDPKADQPARS